MSAANLASAMAAAAADRAFMARENRFLWRALAAVTGIALVLAVSLAIQVMRGSPEPDIVASTADGRIIPATRLDEPMMNEDALRQALARAIVETFTLSFHDYRMRLEQARRYYTDASFAELVEQLEQTGFIKRLTGAYQVCEAILEGVPTVVSQQRHDGVLYLAFETPILLTFRAGTRTRTARFLVRSLVTRTPLSENVRGWAIAQTVLERRTGDRP